MTGQDLAPAAGALALAGLACLAAVIATRGRGPPSAGRGARPVRRRDGGRRERIAQCRPRHRGRGHQGELFGVGRVRRCGSTTGGTSSAGGTVVTGGSSAHALLLGVPWRVAVFAGAAALIVAGAVTAWRGMRWPVMSGRYERSAQASPARPGPRRPAGAGGRYRRRRWPGTTARRPEPPAPAARNGRAAGPRPPMPQPSGRDHPAARPAAPRPPIGPPTGPCGRRSGRSTGRCDRRVDPAAIRRSGRCRSAAPALDPAPSIRLDCGTRSAAVTTPPWARPPGPRLVPPAEPSARHPAVLLAEHEPEVAELARRYLARADLTVTVAANAEDTIAALCEHPALGRRGAGPDHARAGRPPDPPPAGPPCAAPAGRPRPHRSFPGRLSARQRHAAPRRAGQRRRLPVPPVQPPPARRPRAVRPPVPSANPSHEPP